jgi:hypothetical protein
METRKIQEKKRPKSVLGFGGNVFLGSGQKPWPLPGPSKIEVSRTYS